MGGSPNVAAQFRISAILAYNKVGLAIVHKWANRPESKVYNNLITPG